MERFGKVRGFLGVILRRGRGELATRDGRFSKIAFVGLGKGGGAGVGGFKGGFVARISGDVVLASCEGAAMPVNGRWIIRYG